MYTQHVSEYSQVSKKKIPAVLFEQEKYEECIEVCEKAVEVGRENRADYKLVAK